MTADEKLLEIAKNLNVLDISKIVIDDPRFRVWSGSSKEYQHHYGKCGLAQHTFEVADLCLKNNEYFGKPVEERKLFLAALFHDAGKMWDYQPKADPMGLYPLYMHWESTPHKRHIHHISRSGIVWQKAFDLHYTAGGQNETWSDEILHAILSHHGQRAWGSPVAPNTKLAWLLHHCDCISARMDDAEKWDQIK